MADGARINAQNQGTGHFIYGKNLKFFIRFGLMVKAKDPVDEPGLLPFLQFLLKRWEYGCAIEILVINYMQKPRVLRVLDRLSGLNVILD